VDQISDQVILLSHGYVVAEGQIQGVRSEVKEQPMQILVRCDRPAAGLAPVRAGPRGGGQDQADGRNLLLRTKDADSLLSAAEPRDSRIRPGSGIRGAGR
jgi:ABC-2 type transport system ATP-binding protein